MEGDNEIAGRMRVALQPGEVECVGIRGRRLGREELTTEGQCSECARRNGDFTVTRPAVNQSVNVRLNTAAGHSAHRGPPWDE